MSTMYRKANSEPEYLNGVLYPREAAAVQMWVVPATVDDLLAAIPKCGHGNYASHIDGLRSYDDVRQGGQYVWCPGGAALGGTDE